MPVLTARIDVHKPSAMNSADYTVLAVACLFRDEDLDTGREVVCCEMDETSPLWSEMGKPDASTWKGHREGQCDHCGARLKYECVVLHNATGDIITVGRDCIRRFFTLNWSLIEDRAVTRALRARRTERFLAAHPTAAPALDWATAPGTRNKFAAEMVEKAIEKGYELSAAQVAAFVRIHAAAVAPVAYKEGRQKVSGVIRSVKIVRDDYKTTRYYVAYKVSVTVETESGLKVWGTLPAQYADAMKPGDEASLVGRTADFTATLAAKDSGFATYSRPSGFVLGAPLAVETVETVEEPEAVAVIAQEAHAPVVSGFPALPCDGASYSVWRAFLRSNRPARTENFTEEYAAGYFAARDRFDALEESGAFDADLVE